MILNIAFRQGELNKNDMTHDELYFTKHLDVHSQKKTRTRARKQKIKQQQQPQGVIPGSNCTVRVYKAINNNSEKKIGIC